MPNSTIEGNVVISGSATVQGSFYPPAQCIGDSHVSADTSKRIDADKLVHQFPVQYGQASGSSIAAATQNVHLARGAGTVESVEITYDTVGTGDRTVTVDYKKSTAGGAFATILSAVITIATGATVRIPIVGTVSSAAYVDGDVFQFVVALGGTTGTQPQGLCCVAMHQEQPS